MLCGRERLMKSGGGAPHSKLVRTPPLDRGAARVQARAMQNAHVIGERIYLRPLERADAAVFQPWFNDPEVTENLALRRPVNLDFEEEFVAGLTRDEHRIVLGIALRDGDALIGNTGLEDIDWVNRHAQFGIAIGARAQWGKGYGTEATRLMVGYAFDHLNLHRVYLNVYETNARAVRVYERLGFRREGVLRQARWQHDRWVDTIVMGLLRHEWKAA
jgi:RimJ/RimL family protein N-acetyltransferase